MENVKSKALTAVVVAVALVVILPFLFTVGIYVLAGFLVAFEALETWAAVTVGAVSGGVGLGLLLGFVGACFFLFRRAWRNTRSGTAAARRSRPWCVAASAARRCRSARVRTRWTAGTVTPW